MRKRKTYNCDNCNHPIVKPKKVDTLKQLADEAVKEFKDGKTLPLDDSTFSE